MFFMVFMYIKPLFAASLWFDIVWFANGCAVFSVVGFVFYEFIKIKIMSKSMSMIMSFQPLNLTLNLEP